MVDAGIADIGESEDQGAYSPFESDCTKLTRGSCVRRWIRVPPFRSSARALTLILGLMLFVLPCRLLMHGCALTLESR